MPSLYDSLLERMEGHQYSNYFSTWCPFDSHKTPALLVFEDGMFKCLSCDRKGTHKQLDKKIGSHFQPKQHTVSKVHPSWRRWEEKYDDLEGIVDAAHRCLKRNKEFQVYLKRRKIYEFVDEGLLGYLEGWLVFPVFSNQPDKSLSVVDVVLRSVRNTGLTRYVVHDSGDAHNYLYAPSWKRVNQSDTIYVVYGIIDSISLHLAGLPSVTGITGKSLNADLLLPLRKHFVIVPDDGEEVEAHRLANKLGWRAKVKEIQYEEKCKDPDDIRRNFGNEYLLQSITT